MAEGTVRGTFSYNVAPARQSLRALRKDLRSVDTWADRSGRSIDRIGSVEQRRKLAGYRKEVRGLTRDLIALDKVADRLDGRTITPSVDIRGIGSALTQLRALNRELNSLDRRRASTGLRNAAGGGGGFSGRMSMGGGRGGGGGAFIGTSGLGIATSRTRTLAAAGAAALPVVQALGGAVTALGSSAIFAAGGAGAVGTAGLAGLAVGIGGIASVAVPATKRLGEAKKAQDNYRMAVREFGRDSTQAAARQRELNIALADAPKGTRRLLADVRALGREWNRQTRSGQSSWIDLLGTGVRTARQLAPTAGRAANRVTGAAAREGRRLGRWATRRHQRRAIGTGAAIFDENLGNVRGAGQNVAETLINITRASRPFLREATEFIRTWTGGWSRSTRDIERTRSKIGRMVAQFRTWFRMLRSAGRLLGTLASQGAGPGGGLVAQFTATMDRWNAWLRSNPTKVREFFERTVRSTSKLASGLAAVAKSLNTIATQLSPVLDRFTTLVSLLGSVGLLTPGAGALAFGAFRGLRGGAGGRGGGGLGGGAGGLVMAGGGGRGGARGLFGGVPGRATAAEVRAGRMGSGAFLMGGATTGTAAVLERRAAARAPAAARFGAGRAALGGVGRLGMGALRGAGRGFWPVALGMGALDFASFNGDVGGRAQAALSGATLGLVPRPVSDAERADRGFQRGRKFIDALGAPTNMASSRTQIAALRNQIATQHTAAAGTRSIPTITPAGVVGTRQVKVTEGEQRELAASNKELRAELADRVRLYEEYRREREKALNERSRQRAGTFFEEFMEGNRRESKRDGAEVGMSRTVNGVLRQVKHMRKAGGRELAQATLDWARQQAKANPKLRGQYDRLVKGIEGRLQGLRGNVRVVHGQILDGSRTQWAQIAGAISSAARRGVDETSAEFIRLRHLAVGALQEMGYGKRAARQLFAARQAGGRSRRAANQAIKSGVGTRGDTSVGGLTQGQRGRATERSGDGPGVPRRGQMDSRPPATSGGLMGAKAGLGAYAQVAQSMGLRVSSGLRPGAVTSSGNMSLHSTGDAFDVAGPQAAMLRYARTMARRFGSGLDELIHTPMGFGIKNGQRIGSFGSAVDKDHFDHVHVGDRTPGGGARGLAGLMGGMGAAPQVSSRASRLGGVPGALATGAGKGYARAINRKLRGLAGGAAGGIPNVGGGGSNRSLGRRMMLAAGWGPDQWQALNALWTGESGWDHTAVNSSSGATGIPQSLPGNKMASAGADWRTNPATQIRWGLGYIRGRYGSPSAAYSAWQGRQPHWYGRGGQGHYRRPTLIGVGDGQPSGGSEQVTVRRLRPGQRPGGGRGGIGPIYVSVSFPNARINTGQDAKDLMEKAAEHAAKKLLRVLGDEVGDEELS